MRRNRLPSILFYNLFFGQRPDLSDLSSDEQQAFVWDRTALSTVDAVVFHIPDLICRDPTLAEFAALHKPVGQVWVAWYMESIVNYPILMDSAFMSSFDLVMSYERTVDIWAPYLPNESTWRKALANTIPRKRVDAAIVLFQSSPINASGRNEYVSELMQHVRIHSYGKFMTNQVLAGSDYGRSTKLTTIAQYKFCLSLENSVTTDYVTEKFFDPLLVGSVPIYRGAPNIRDFEPGKHSFINADDFSCPRRLAQFVIALGRNDDAYRQYFRWREQPFSSTFKSALEGIRESPFARLLTLLIQRNLVTNRSP